MEWKTSSLFLDRASAAVFYTPGIWLALKKNWNFAVMNAKQKSPRLPITPEILLRIKGVWERESPARDKAMLWAAASLCFLGFLRSGEMCIPAEKAFDEGAHLSGHFQLQELIQSHTLDIVSE